jgi:hypothetical protein
VTLGIGIVLGLQAIGLLVISHSVKGLVVDGGPNSGLIHPVNEYVAFKRALLIQNNPKEVPGMVLKGTATNG